MAQASYPWQFNGNIDDAPQAPRTPPSSTGGLRKSKKRQRSDSDARIQEIPHKKQHRSTKYHPSGIPLPPRPSNGGVEVIEILDDDDKLPPQRGAYVYPPAVPQYYAQGMSHHYDQGTPQYYGQGMPQIYGQGTAPLVAGSQFQPFEIDQYPRQEPEFAPAYDSVDSKQYNTPMPTGEPSLGHGYNGFYDDLSNYENIPPNPSLLPTYDDLDWSKYRHPPPPPPPPPVVPNTEVADIVPIAEPTLCPEQAELVDLILSGRNVFYTGSAGCGKSTVLKAFVKRFQARGMMVNIIAPTGRAALDINGSTTWTYAGWTPDSHKKPLKELKANAHGKFVQKRLSETDVLVIDEISMVENLHFERLNAVMKEARGNERAFGGVQLVVTGDFCQLPPVKPFRHCIDCGRELVKNKQETEFKCRNHGTYYDRDKWAFRSQAWKECDFVHVNLTTIHRQSDKVFIAILNNLRMGVRLSQESIDLLLNHKSETRGAIKLFATREEVKRVNDEKFRALRTTARDYDCHDHFQWNEKHGNLKNKGDRGIDGSMLSLREHRFESKVQLKKGMLVVLLHNLDLGAGLVNGSQGTIQRFEDFDPAKLPKAANSRRNEEALMSGAPALQGDHAAFREEQLKQYANRMKFKAWPVVRFLNGVERTIYADCTVNELGDEVPHSLLSRTQIPLMAAWAMTTHKSQGMTLNRVIVNLAKSFEQGQAYVALSRARSLDGLKVESFPPSAEGSGNPQVKEFLREKFGIGV